MNSETGGERKAGEKRGSGSGGDGRGLDARACEAWKDMRERHTLEEDGDGEENGEREREEARRGNRERTSVSLKGVDKARREEGETVYTRVCTMALMWCTKQSTLSTERK